jgi:hypothetical protein
LPKIDWQSKKTYCPSGLNLFFFVLFLFFFWVNKYMYVLEED